MSPTVKKEVLTGTKKDSERSMEEHIAMTGELEIARMVGRFTREMEGFRAVYEKTDRIISNRDVQVIIDTKGSVKAPAWTDGIRIWLNGLMLADKLGREDFSVWVRHTKSLNLHELSHVLFTPRQNSEMSIWIKQAVAGHHNIDWAAQKQIKKAWNILEDQRIETLFVAKYRPAGAYFESNVLQWMLATPQQWESAHMLCHGRRFLPTKMRATLRLAFVTRWGQSIADAVEDIIDQYLMIVHPTDNAKAKALITKLAHIIRDMQHNGADLHPMNNPDDANDMAGDQPDEKEQRQARERIKNVEPRDTEPKDEECDNESGSSTEEGEEEDGQEESGSGGEPGGDQDGEEDSAGEDDSGEGAGSGAEQEASPEQQGLNDSDEGVGAGHGGDVPLKQNDFMEDMRKQFDDLLQDEDFKADVQRVGKAIQDAINDGEMIAQGDDVNANLHPTPDDVKQAARTMEKQLREIKVVLEEQHFRHQTHGQIDPAAFLTRKPWEVDFFRSYDPGALEDVDVEAVILIDQSTSMQNQMTAVSQALWSLKKSLEDIDARVTVLGFSDGCYLLYGPNDKLHNSQMKVFGSKGGTYPIRALTEAYKVLQASRRKIRLLVTLTDGEWYGDREKANKMVQAVNGVGAITQLLYLGHIDSAASLERHRHEHQSVIGIRKPQDLAISTARIVRDAMALSEHGEV